MASLGQRAPPASNASAYNEDECGVFIDLLFHGLEIAFPFSVSKDIVVPNFTTNSTEQSFICRETRSWNEHILLCRSHNGEAHVEGV